MWVKHDLADRIALLYIYMPRIRYEFAEFVRLWNAHYIRKQKARPHVVPGKPWVLYNLPDPEKVKDYRAPAPLNVLQELMAIINQDGADLDMYLPEETMTICDNIVASFGGINYQLTDDTRKTPFIVEYHRLRTQLRQYIDGGHQPAVSLCPSLVGSLAHLRTWLEEKGVDLEDLNVESDIETDIEIA